jgi:hypothetical protein
MKLLTYFQHGNQALLTCLSAYETFCTCAYALSWLCTYAVLRFFNLEALFEWLKETSIVWTMNHTLFHNIVYNLRTTYLKFGMQFESVEPTRMLHNCTVLHSYYANSTLNVTLQSQSSSFCRELFWIVPLGVTPFRTQPHFALSTSHNDLCTTSSFLRIANPAPIWLSLHLL